MEDNMRDSVIVYHNPRCSKSRMALDYLDAKGIAFEIREYLKEPPSNNEIKSILDKLQIPAQSLLRKGEYEYKENFAGKILNEAECIKAMIQFPKLIERPIVIKSNRAVIARPTEKIDELF